MKIALVQLDANDCLWKSSEMAGLLRPLKDMDLVVFPECMPFDKSSSVEYAEAVSILEGVSRQSRAPAFMAGGYVLQNEIMRNAVFLTFAGKTVDSYFKRSPWQEPDISPGGESKKFIWKKGSCVPLICADAADNPSPNGTRMMYEAIRCGACSDVPIVVASYGTWLFEDYWQEPLNFWSRGTGAPVVICGVSGVGDSFEDNGILGNYGGGGSGVFWPDGQAPSQRKNRGIHIVDTVSRRMRSMPIPRP